MTDEQNIAVVETDVVPESEPSSLLPAAKALSELLNEGAMSLQTQDLPGVRSVTARAKAIYAEVERVGGKPVEVLTIRLLAEWVRLYSPLASGMAYQLEGRYAKASEEMLKGIAITDSASALVEDYARMPGHDPEFLEVLFSMFGVFKVLLRGAEFMIQAEVFGYQGKIGKYLQLLKESVTVFRQVDSLPGTANPIAITLRGMCLSLADRLETRAEFFELKGEEDQERYVTPSGSKVFIIHGHDEAKWRELSDLLEEEFRLEPLVLKETASGGKTLISKFEEGANDCCYAFAIMTPDDFVTNGSSEYLQARPNVLFELGWFYGRFGRKRVCILTKKGTELPSDLDGILTIPFTERISEVFTAIRGELRGLGLVQS